MKVFRFVKKVFFIGLTILLNFTNAVPLNCISMKNQKCKTRLQVINVNNNPIFYPFIIKTSKNVVVVVIILTIRMQKFVFLML